MSDLLTHEEIAELTGKTKQSAQRRGSGVTMRAKTEEEAVAKWNRRIAG